jgi:hypothetical protein
MKKKEYISLYIVLVVREQTEMGFALVNGVLERKIRRLKILVIVWYRIGIFLLKKHSLYLIIFYFFIYWNDT